MRQISRQEAIAIFQSKLYEDWSYEQKVKFQLFQDRLSMPFDVFHEAIEKVLKRPVYTHEFGLNRDGLQKEFLGEICTPTFEDIIALIPKDKLLIIEVDE